MPIEQLLNVEIGDLVLLIKYDKEIRKPLTLKEYEVAGFVDAVKSDSERSFVRLSHENSYISDAFAARKGPRSAGDRWYDLSAFDDYKVLMRKKDRNKKEKV